MPWSNQGGGPWGSGGGGGGKGPWGSGPQHSGPTPPDLEEFLRRSQDKLRTVLPGGNLGGKGLSLILLAAVFIWGLSGFFRVDPDELGRLERLCTDAPALSSDACDLLRCRPRDQRISCIDSSEPRNANFCNSRRSTVIRKTQLAAEIDASAGCAARQCASCGRARRPPPLRSSSFHCRPSVEFDLTFAERAHFDGARCRQRAQITQSRGVTRRRSARVAGVGFGAFQ